MTDRAAEDSALKGFEEMGLIRVDGENVTIVDRARIHSYTI